MKEVEGGGPSAKLCKLNPQQHNGIKLDCAILMILEI